MGGVRGGRTYRRQSAKRESLANSRGSTRGQGNPADGLDSVANVEIQNGNWSSIVAGGPRCPRYERIANEPPTFRASLSQFIQMAGGGERQRVSVLETWSYITPLQAAGLLRR
jgi:hypothetical protein